MLNKLKLGHTEQPDPTAEFKKFTFDEMKSALEKWLSPEEGEEMHFQLKKQQPLLHQILV